MSAAVLKAAYGRHAEEEGFLDELAAIAEDPALEIQATWMIKRGIDEGRRRGSATDGKILLLLRSVGSWQAKLHLLQCIPNLAISQPVERRIEKELFNLSRDRNKFVRAWAYSGLYYLAEQHGRHRAEVHGMLRRALESDSPSVKARIRNLPNFRP